MEKLNVTCDACNKGKLVTLNLLHDDYKMGCDTCDHTFIIHYTGYDCIMDAHEYNNQVCEDIQILNANGSWMTGKGKMNLKAPAFRFENHTENMKLIQTIEADEIRHYYQNGASFIQIAYNQVHRTYDIFEFKANEKSMPNLMNHFFGIKA